MEAISFSPDVKGFTALLNGLNGILFSDTSVNKDEDYQVLQEKVYKNVADLDPQEMRNEMNIFESILKKAAQDNWSNEQLQEFLTTRQFSNDFTPIFINFWNKESIKIHKYLLSKVTFNHSLIQLSYRVDMQAMSKSSREINEPIASLEWKLQNKASQEQQKSTKIAKFDMNRSEVKFLLDSLNEIQLTYDGLVNKSS